MVTTSNSPLSPNIKPKQVDFDPFVQGELESIVPITDSQRELWLSHQLGDDAACAYNESLTLIFKGQLNITALRIAIQDLVMKHEALRANFSPSGDTLCFLSSFQIELPFIDLSQLSKLERDEQYRHILADEMDLPFNLEFGPLFRTKIIKMQDQEHNLIISAHHIICDGWSWSVLLSDLKDFYNARNVNLPIVKEEADKYSNYAQKMVKQKNSLDYHASETFWKETFSKQIPQLDLPTDHIRPSLRSFQSKRIDWEIPHDLQEQLKKYASHYNCSFMAMLIASFSVLFFRITHQETIDIGIAVAGQAIENMPKLVGHCVNILPLHITIDPKGSFKDHLIHCKKIFLDAYDHPQLSFGKIVEILHLQRDPSRIPLVPAIINLDQAISEDILKFSNLEVATQTNSRHYEAFEIFFNVSQYANKMVFECQYNTDLFDGSTINHWFEMYQTLLEGIIKKQDDPIGRLPILSIAEIQKNMMEWNNTKTEYAKEKCIHELFEKQANMTPEAIAITFGNEHITYRLLNQHSNQVARQLREMGAGPDTMVGLYMERSIDMVIGLLGILKTGGAYVPLDPIFPMNRIDYIMQDSDMRILITQDKLFNTLPTRTIRILNFDESRSMIEMESEGNLPPVNSESVAYLIYTSGSTGKPKGVEIRHFSVVNCLEYLNHLWEISPQDKQLAVTTLTFDVSIMDIFPPLTTGAELIIASNEEVHNGILLTQMLDSLSITLMQATPTTWQLLFDSGWKGKRDLTVICGGEAVTRTLAYRLADSCKKVFNAYGPTETTIYSSISTISSGQPVTIGNPLANTSLYVLDENLQLVPYGISGELFIGGDGLARGYHNRPDLNSQRFIPDPYHTQIGNRLYRTGDVVRRLENGSLEYLQRSDRQVKIRGFRIELEEIENVLSQHREVSRVVVITKEKETKEKHLVAYIVPKPGGNLNSQDLRQFLKEKLPEYMIPSVFITMDSLPLTINAKIDLLALPEPEKIQSCNDETYADPRTPLEDRLAYIFKEILGVEYIGVDDNFFDLGGHSLLAARLFAMIKDVFGKSLPLATIFQNPTISQIADVLNQAEIPVKWPLLIPMKTSGSKPPFYCIHGISGTVSFFYPITKHLDPDQPVFGIHSTVGNGQEEKPITIEDIATNCIREIRALQPQGPYLIGGYSFGGAVAYEMGRQMYLQDGEQPLIVIFDTTPNMESLSFKTRLIKRIEFEINRIIYHLKNLSSLSLRQWREYLTPRFINMISDINRMLAGDFPDWVEGNGNLWYINYRAYENYRIKPFPGKVALFKAQEIQLEYINKVYGWDYFAQGGVDIYHVPGNHNTIMDKINGPILAKSLQTCIDNKITEIKDRKA